MKQVLLIVFTNLLLSQSYFLERNESSISPSFSLVHQEGENALLVPIGITITPSNIFDFSVVYSQRSLAFGIGGKIWNFYLGIGTILEEKAYEEVVYVRNASLALAYLFYLNKTSIISLSTSVFFAPSHSGMSANAVGLSFLKLFDSNLALETSISAAVPDRGTALFQASIGFAYLFKL